MYVCVCVCVCVCMCVCVCVYIYIYIYTDVYLYMYLFVIRSVLECENNLAVTEWEQGNTQTVGLEMCRILDLGLCLV